MEAAGDIPLDEAELRAHLERFDTAYVAEVVPRSVVRHLLMLRRPPRSGEVASRVTPRPDQRPGQAPDQPDGRRDLDVVTIDTPGLFSRICGVVSLAGGQVIGAHAHTTSDGVAVDTVEVEAPEGVLTSWWARFEGDLVDAMAGRIALRARVDQMARDVGGPSDRSVTVDVADGSGDWGAGDEVRVRTPDRLGLLFAITDALADLRLDIRSAVIETRGGTADDHFVVRTAGGGGLDADQASQVGLAVSWAVARLGGEGDGGYRMPPAAMRR